MNLDKFCDKFIVIIEIKNILNHLQIPEDDDEIWEIKDNIIFEYEDYLNYITSVKIQAYNVKQLENKIKQNENDIINIQNDIYKLDMKQRLKNNQINLSIEREKCIQARKDNMTQTPDNYQNYQSNAVMFLKKYKYFKFSSQHVLTPNIIPTTF